MGYDMYWRHEPDEVREAYSAVDACDGYDAEVYGRWFAAQERTGSYFCLNIWGMGEYRQHMARRGMLANLGSPRYPEPTSYGVPVDSDGDVRATAEQTHPTQYRAWRDAVEQWRASDTGGVMPAYKFCSNDAWVVTPDEITRALEALHRWEDAQRARHGDDWEDPLRGKDGGLWDRWIRFLYCARSHGGVVVT